MPPKNRPRPYTTLDRDYLAQDTIRDLGDQFGPAGPLTFLAVILNAGKAITAGQATAVGVVELRWRTLAREAFVDVPTAQRIIGVCVELDLLDSYADMDGGRFAARLTKAERWDSYPLTDAERSANYRARKAAERHERHEEP